MLELGAGVAGILAVLLSRQVKKYIATDQAYVLGILKDNIAANLAGTPQARPSSRRKRGQTPSKRALPTKPPESSGGLGNISLLQLDWVSDEARLPLVIDGARWHPNLIIACDLIFNEAVTEPLVQTCWELLQSAEADPSSRLQPPMLLVASELRSFDVFRSYLDQMLERGFQLYRVRDECLPNRLQQSAGIAVHIAWLR